jgi:hypothetical protein
MTNGLPELDKLYALLDADFLEDSDKEIIRDTIRRTIRMFPEMLDIAEATIKGLRA